MAKQAYNNKGKRKQAAFIAIALMAVAGIGLGATIPNTPVNNFVNEVAKAATETAEEGGIKVIDKSPKATTPVSEVRDPEVTSSMTSSLLHDTITITRSEPVRLTYHTAVADKIQLVGKLSLTSRTPQDPILIQVSGVKENLSGIGGGDFVILQADRFNSYPAEYYDRTVNLTLEPDKDYAITFSGNGYIDVDLDIEYSDIE